MQYIFRYGRDEGVTAQRRVERSSREIRWVNPSINFNFLSVKGNNNNNNNIYHLKIFSILLICNKNVCHFLHLKSCIFECVILYGVCVNKQLCLNDSVIRISKCQFIKYDQTLKFKRSLWSWKSLARFNIFYQLGLKEEKA